MVPGARQGAGLAVGGALALVEQQDLAVQLVADLHRQLALAGDGLAQRVELRVLVRQDLPVVGVDLGVGEVGGGDVVAVACAVVVGGAAGGVGVVAVGEEGVVVFVVGGGLGLEVCGGGGEADCLFWLWL